MKEKALHLLFEYGVLGYRTINNYAIKVIELLNLAEQYVVPTVYPSIAKAEHQPDIVAIQETKLKINDSSPSFTGYSSSSLRKYRVLFRRKEEQTREGALLMNFENRWVLRSALNLASDGEVVREVDREFQRKRPEKAKADLAKECLTRVKKKREQEDDCKPERLASAREQDMEINEKRNGHEQLDEQQS
ncbi:hypothetical protein HELRODRAFT_166825 [Helobdella robusta]|uniref:Uncharacterized protein n=1 Tax=Helobdella robusta TaxID=6412 RepID=T1EYK9_HELRO|nr:hypothetical protein HELRODRAFT_166825 [Helobdella robusta]ESO11783.1 hypothetical protein HELRODRAFT_166825 [Helobdella robusta]